MRKLSLLSFSVLALAVSGGSLATNPPSKLPIADQVMTPAVAAPLPAHHVVVPPSAMRWTDGPVGLPAGAQMVLLGGDPASSDPFTLRAKFPPGFRIPAHSHPTSERVTVLSGTLMVGSGDKLDEAASEAVPAGGWVMMPAGMHHFAWTKDGAVIQLDAVGPWGITYVNPADDPRAVSRANVGGK